MINDSDVNVDDGDGVLKIFGECLVNERDVLQFLLN